MSISRGRRPSPDTIRTNAGPLRQPAPLFAAAPERVAPPPHVADEPSPGLDDAIERATRHLLSTQAPDGYWWAELESNVTMAAEHVLLEHFLGIADARRTVKLQRYILGRQSEDGSWPIYAGGPGDVSVTIEAYFALKLTGIDPLTDEMARARLFVRAHGGVANARIFTRLWLSLFGQSDWAAMPIMPPEAILLPSWFPLNIYEFASWARATIVAILV
ncbi:MAG: squalene--hopene cyclase, partial [Tepidiformaceae bacterium]